MVEKKGLRKRVEIGVGQRQKDVLEREYGRSDLDFVPFSKQQQQ